MTASTNERTCELGVLWECRGDRHPDGRPLQRDPWLLIFGDGFVVDSMEDADKEKRLR